MKLATYWTPNSLLLSSTISRRLPTLSSLQAALHWLKYWPLRFEIWDYAEIWDLPFWKYFDQHFRTFCSDLYYAVENNSRAFRLFRAINFERIYLLSYFRYIIPHTQPPRYLNHRMSAAPSTPTSMELWAASKFAGRECASISKAYLECKQEKGKNPYECISHAEPVQSCYNNV